MSATVDIPLAPASDAPEDWDAEVDARVAEFERWIEAMDEAVRKFSKKS